MEIKQRVSNYATWTNPPTGTSTTDPYTSDSLIRQNLIEETAGSSTVPGAAGFTYAGNYNGVSVYNVGTSGVYWSSSVYSTNNGYRLYFNTTNVNPQGNDTKSLGRAVRCLAGTS